MRVLPILAVVALAPACYSPDTANCTVTCASASECGNGQVCGADGFCAAPDVAGHCSAASPDAAVQEANVALRIVIAGQGRVQIQGLGICDASGPTHGDCTLMVPPRVARMLTAVKTQQDFVGWTTPACAGQGMTCTMTPTTAIQVGAKFGGGGQ